MDDIDIPVEAICEGDTIPGYGVMTSIRFKKNERGLMIINHRTSARHALVVWESDRAKLERKVRKSFIRVIK